MTAAGRHGGVTAPESSTAADARHHAEHRRALIKIGQLETLAAAIRDPRPLDAVMELVLAQIFDVIPADAAAVWLYDSDRDRWYIAGAKGLTRRASEISFKSDQTLHSRIGDQGEILANMNSVGFRRLYPEHDLIQGVLYAPMTIVGRRVGLIALYRNSSDPFTEDDLAFVRTVGSQIGMAVSFAALEARAGREAVLEDRARLGADLHDGILQILSSVRIYVRELRSTLARAEPDLPSPAGLELGEILARLEGCVDSGSEEIQAAIQQLRRPEAATDVAANLELARRRLEDRGIAAAVVCDIGDIALEVAGAIAWILREAVSNVIQHSHAGHVSIELRQTGGEVRLDIADDGAGTGSQRRGGREGDDAHLGIHIMRERAMHLGGRLEVLRGEHGTLVRATMPAVPVDSGSLTDPGWRR